MKTSTFASLVLAFTVTLAASGCGKYGSPLPPEALAPRAAEELAVTADAQGVILNWKAPDLDRRGKELKFIEGYQVRRAEITEDFLGTTPGELEWEEVGFVEDTHVVVREKLREEARAQGKVGRRVDAPADLKKFDYRDAAVVPGKVYLYRVVPVNQGGTEGVSRTVFRVMYRGATSEISTVDRQRVEGITGEEELSIAPEWETSTGGF